MADDTPGAPPKELRYFKSDHLPEPLKTVSAPFGTLAANIVATLPDCEQRRLSLQWLLIAKDAAVRAALEASR